MNTVPTVKYALPTRCQHCGNVDKARFRGDWSGIDCGVCGKRTPYVVVSRVTSGRERMTQMTQ